MGLALIETETLSSIGTAIRSKTGETASYKPSQMAEAINGIKVGADLPENVLVLSGNIGFYNYKDNWTWFLNLYGDRMSSNGITTMPNAFMYSTCEIPFDINLTKGNVLVQLDYAFHGCNITTIPVINGEIERAIEAFTDCSATSFKSDLTFSGTEFSTTNMINMPNLLELPYLYNLNIDGWTTTRKTSDKDYTYTEIYEDTMNSMFAGCRKIKSMPEDYADTWTVKRVVAEKDFWNCHSLRSVPTGVLNKLFSNCVSYTQNFMNCYALETIEGFPVTTARYGARRDGYLPTELTPVEITENMFKFYNSSDKVYNFLVNCGRLTKFTFAETIEPIKWSNQLIHFQNVGYDSNAAIVDTGRGEFTLENQVYDDTTYAALKDNPDWWSADVNYSRYNKVSALETIASLPDTSAFGTNIIMFNSAQGSKTDGGSIGSMTAEEIAVAAAKGWTVSLI